MKMLLPCFVKGTLYQVDLLRLTLEKDKHNLLIQGLTHETFHRWNQKSFQGIDNLRQLLKHMISMATFFQNVNQWIPIGGKFFNEITNKMIRFLNSYIAEANSWPLKCRMVDEGLAQLISGEGYSIPDEDIRFPKLCFNMMESDSYNNEKDLKEAEKILFDEPLHLFYKLGFHMAKTVEEKWATKNSKN